jgi:hypothetical protein
MKPETFQATSLHDHIVQFRAEAVESKNLATIYTGSMSLLAIVGVIAPVAIHDVSKGLVVSSASAVGIAVGYARRRAHQRTAKTASKSADVLDKIITNRTPADQLPPL